MGDEFVAADKKRETVGVRAILAVAKARRSLFRSTGRIAPAGEIETARALPARKRPVPEALHRRLERFRSGSASPHGGLPIVPPCFAGQHNVKCEWSAGIRTKQFRMRSIVCCETCAGCPLVAICVRNGPEERVIARSCGSEIWGRRRIPPCESRHTYPR